MPDNNVTDIQKYKPAVTIVTKNAVHVMPTHMIRDLISGKLKITECDDYNEWLPVIIEQWFKELTRYEN